MPGSAFVAEVNMMSDFVKYATKAWVWWLEAIRGCMSDRTSDLGFML
jgi:hypothetical protein